VTGQGKSRRGWRRYKGLFGLAAVCAFLLALPAAAMACVSANTCQGGGGIPDSPPGQCGGGAYNGLAMCSGNNDQGELGQSLLSGYIEWDSLTRDTEVHDPSSDPFGYFTSIQDKGSQTSSASGTISGPTGSSHTSDVGGGLEGTYNASKTISLSANQQLVLGALFLSDSQRTTFAASPGLPATVALSSARLDSYTFSGFARYLVGPMYVVGYVTGNFGRGSSLNGTTGAAGNFNTGGYAVGGAIGKTYTLFDSRKVIPSSLLPTKAPPKTTDDGFALQLNVDANLGYAQDQVDGFTDSSGFIRGDELIHYWTVGGEARLSAIIPRAGLTWTPYAAANISQQFGFSHTLDIPTQPGQGADTIFFGSAQTFAGTLAGINATNAAGIILGIEGFYKQSSEYQVAGGDAYLRFRFPE
jgi:hypothetical protein